MSTPAAALERAVVPWLVATAAATTLPHLEHQPPWLVGAITVCFLASVGLWWTARRLPGRWSLAMLVIAACGGIVAEFRTLLGQDAGVAMLVLFMAMKLLELRSRRDAYVVITLAYFLLLTHYFYSQSVLTGLWLLTALIVVTATLVRLNGGPASGPGASLRYAVTLNLQALPLMLLLYLLFPRIAGPLWGLPQDAHTGSSGLSEQMSPGTIASLVRNPEIAFRAHFTASPPAQDKLYWRGPVMEAYDGITWRTRPGAGSATIVAVAAPTDYEITLEAHNQRWLLALDAPVTLPPDTRRTGNLVVLAREPVTLRQRLHFASVLDYRFNVDESPQVLLLNRSHPPRRNPRAQALAESWRRAEADPERLVERALALFRDEAFAYTLQPPLLGEHPVDDFLFDSRRGFCEHYAAAFVVLMRFAGIPARVVAGYQGGELNPVDGYLVVRQSDAHAWAEVWLPGRGWIRVDPTAVVSPARVEAGIRAAVPPGEGLPVLLRADAEWLRELRFRWEALNNSWNQQVLGYNPQRQRELFSRLGLPDPDWRALAGLLLGSGGTLVLVMTAWILYRRPRADPAQRLWLRALARLRRQGIAIPPWEAPLALAQRMTRERPELAAAATAVAQAYCAARYGPSAVDLTTLRTAVARLP